MFRNKGEHRTLQGRLDSMLFEPTALSRKSDALLAEELAALRERSELSSGLRLKASCARQRYSALKDERSNVDDDRRSQRVSLSTDQVTAAVSHRSLVLQQMLPGL